MRIAKKVAPCLALYWFLALPLPGQVPASGSPSKPPVVRVTTRLVQINVIAQDKKGQLIKDLTQDDFQVTERGKPQKVSVFSIESNEKAVGRATILPANTFSNMPAQSGASQNLTVVLIDLLNTPSVNQAEAKDQVIRFLQQIGPLDRVALYGLGNSLQILHDFTSSPQALVRAITSYKTRLPSEQISSLPPIEDHTTSMAWETEQEKAIIAMMENFLNETNRFVGDVYIERRMAITVDALEAISCHLAALPGRKNLVWLSGAIPFSYGSDTFQVNNANPGSKNFSGTLMRAARAINTANVAIYPVDARGFMGVAQLNPSSTAETGLSGGVRQLNQRRDTSIADDVLSSHNTMQELAEQTGGRAMYNNTDVNGAIRSVLEESRLTYTLGYYPADTKFDGKFRTIKVTVSRPDVQVRYRRGYYALPDEPLDAAHRQNAINAAAVTLLDATAVGFTAAIGQPDAGSSIRPIALEVDPSSVTLEPEPELFVGGLDAVFVQFDAHGKILTSIGRTVPIKLTAPQRDQLLQQGLVLNAPIDINSQCERLRIIIRDVGSGNVGTLTIPLK